MDKISQNVLELLDRYLDHNLTEEEQVSVDQLLRQDFSVQQALENLKMMRGIIESNGMKQLVRKQHHEYMAVMKQNELHVTRTRTLFSEMRNNWMKVAALIILILSTGFLIQFLLLDADSIYRHNFISYDLSGKRSNAISTDIAMDSLYQNRLFTEVVSSFQSIPSHSFRDLFLTGMAYLQINNPSKAIPLFEEIHNRTELSGEMRFQQETDYYLALAYLRNHQTDSALELFRKIHEDPRHLYHKNISKWELIKIRLLDWKL